MLLTRKTFVILYPHFNVIVNILETRPVFHEQAVRDLTIRVRTVHILKKAKVWRNEIKKTILPYKILSKMVCSEHLSYKVEILLAKVLLANTTNKKFRVRSLKRLDT